MQTNFPHSNTTGYPITGGNRYLPFAGSFPLVSLALLALSIVVFKGISYGYQIARHYFSYRPNEKGGRDYMMLNIAKETLSPDIALKEQEIAELKDKLSLTNLEKEECEKKLSLAEMEIEKTQAKWEETKKEFQKFETDAEAAKKKSNLTIVNLTKQLRKSQEECLKIETEKNKIINNKNEIYNKDLIINELQKELESNKKQYEKIVSLSNTFLEKFHAIEKELLVNAEKMKSLETLGKQKDEKISVLEKNYESLRLKYAAVKAAKHKKKVSTGSTTPPNTTIDDEKKSLKPLTDEIQTQEPLVVTEDLSSFKQVGGHKGSVKRSQVGVVKKETTEWEIETYHRINDPNNKMYSPLKSITPKFVGKVKEASVPTFEMEDLTANMIESDPSFFTTDVKMGSIYNTTIDKIINPHATKPLKGLQQGVYDFVTPSYAVQTGNLLDAMHSKKIIKELSQKLEIHQKESLIKQLQEILDQFHKSEVASYGTSTLLVGGRNKEGKKIALAKMIDLSNALSKKMAEENHCVDIYEKLRKHFTSSLTALIEDIQKA